MDKLAPILLPAALGLIAGITHGMASQSMELPTTLGDNLGQTFQTGRALRD